MLVMYLHILRERSNQISCRLKANLCCVPSLVDGKINVYKLLLIPAQLRAGIFLLKKGVFIESKGVIKRI